MKRVALILAPVKGWMTQIKNAYYKIPSMGVLYIATYLELRGYKVKIFDFMATDVEREDFRAHITAFAPEVVGFSLYPNNWETSRKIMSLIKEKLPQTRFVAGGHFPTFAYEELLTEEMSLDYVVMGEGEETLTELLVALSNPTSFEPGAIRGLCYRDGHNRVVRNQRRDPIACLDDLPIPDRKYLDMSVYTVPYTISTARGCTGKCTYCSTAAMFSKYRTRSVDSVMQEVHYLVDEYRMKEFFIVDDTFTVFPDRVAEFCRRLKSECPKLLWVCESRANVMNAQMARTLADAGCTRVQMGLESASNEILRKLRKGITVEQFEQAVRHLRDCSIDVTVSFFYGHPWDTPETMQALTDFVGYLIARYKVIPGFGVNTPFPGTYQYVHFEQLGMTNHAKSWDEYTTLDPMVSSKGFTLNELRTAYATAVEMFY